ncbi:MAG: hypothetical protein IKA94_07095 [Mogibacterium sp.]|nr:hypothetical protein [Mogibacterium sp.]
MTFAVGQRGDRMGKRLVYEEDAIEALAKELKGVFVEYRDIAEKLIGKLPSAQPHWIPVTERLPEERDWYLGIFEEPDTGWINPLPFICDYLLGKETKATTKEGWILKGYTDREEHIDYYFNLECVAWMLLPKPWKDMRGEQDE